MSDRMPLVRLVLIVAAMLAVGCVDDTDYRVAADECRLRLRYVTTLSDSAAMLDTGRAFLRTIGTERCAPVLARDSFNLRRARR